jgi:hypothetical protein
MLASREQKLTLVTDVVVFFVVVVVVDTTSSSQNVPEEVKI